MNLRHEDEKIQLERNQTERFAQPATMPPDRPSVVDEDVPLFAPDATDEFRSRWDVIQTAFVDEPREAVRQADELVDRVIQNLSEMFADERGKLESQWQEGENVSTEDLRVVLQRYRSFFRRLLTI